MSLPTDMTNEDWDIWQRFSRSARVMTLRAEADDFYLSLAFGKVDRQTQRVLVQAEAGIADDYARGAA